MTQPPGAAHHFDEVVALFAALDRSQQLLRVAGAVRDRHADFARAEVDFGFLDAFGAADGRELDLIERLARHDLVDRAQRGFHNAARHAEDDAGAGGVAEHIVEVLVGQPREVDARGFDHPRQPRAPSAPRPRRPDRHGPAPRAGIRTSSPCRA